jgi:hypothetical protein
MKKLISRYPSKLFIHNLSGRIVILGNDDIPEEVESADWII